MVAVGTSSESEASLAESALLSEESLKSDFRSAANSLVRGFESKLAVPNDVVDILNIGWLCRDDMRLSNQD